MEVQETIRQSNPQNDQSDVQQSERSRYRNSFAATVLFSGVQIYQILIRIIKSKFVALFIGPAGMGIQSLLHSTTDTISAATNLGLKTSSVKTISAANRDGNREVIAKTITVLRRLIWITGMVGLVLCAVLAPVWSKTAFGNDTYIWSFTAVSVIILLDQLNNGELALLQGMQEKRKLAKANVIGQTINAIVTIPLYYLYGVKAIVAAFIVGSLLTYIISRYYSRTIDIDNVRITWRETFSYGGEMIKLGFFLSLQYFLSTLMLWIIRNFVSNTGSVEDVGLYTAGTSIVTTYIGLVFTAIATDYFPRLAATKSNEEMSSAIHTQAELTIMLLTPLIIAFIVFCRPVIVLLYSSKFLPIEQMMCWSLCAVLLQAMAWAISYSLLAKAKPHQFFLNEVGSIVYTLLIRLLAYHYFGLTGFGIAAIITYGLYLIQCVIVSKKLFGFNYSSSIWRLLCLLLIPVGIVVTLKLYSTSWVNYVVGSIIFAITLSLVIYRLDKKMGIVGAFKLRIQKKINI